MGTFCLAHQSFERWPTQFLPHILLAGLALGCGLLLLAIISLYFLMFFCHPFSVSHSHSVICSLDLKILRWLSWLIGYIHTYSCIVLLVMLFSLLYLLLTNLQALRFASLRLCPNLLVDVAVFRSHTQAYRMGHKNMYGGISFFFCICAVHTCFVFIMPCHMWFNVDHTSYIYVT